MLDKNWIAARIPHQGSMCLLDQVVDWSEEHILCLTNTHRLPDNPLRLYDQLGAACGIEYAAQAMAVHGALLANANTRPSKGYLTSVRDVELLSDRLDTVEGGLHVLAERLSGDDNIVLYRFTLTTQDQLPLLRGRAAVVMDADRL